MSTQVKSINIHTAVEVCGRTVTSQDIVVRCCVLPSQMAQKQCAGPGLSQPVAASPLHFQGPGLAGREGSSACCFLPMVYQK